MKKIYFLVILFLSSCGKSDDSFYTLYRSSEAPVILRVHVATFDSNDGEKFNRVNCQIAAELFQSQPLVVVDYWCEKGRYRK